MAASVMPMSTTDALVVDLTLADEVATGSGSIPQHLFDDEALARRVASESEVPPAFEEDEAIARSLAAEISQQSQQVLDDEALALKLAAEESTDWEGHDSQKGEAVARSSAAEDSQQSQQVLDDAALASRLASEASQEDLQLNSAASASVQLPAYKDLPSEVLHEVNILWAEWLRGEGLSVNQQATISRNYRVHAVHALLQEFPRAPAQVLQRAFERSNSYTEARRYMESSSEKESLKCKRKPCNAPPCSMPRALAREIKHGERTMTPVLALQQWQEAHAARKEQLRILGGLGTCGCCFGDDVLPEDELRCTAAEGHGFCIPCVKNRASSFFGEKLFTLNLTQKASSSSSTELPSSTGAADLSCTVVPCMHISGCSGHFSDAALQRALPAKEYVRYSRRSAALQAASSGLKDLVACPNCDFMIEMSDATDGILRCLNPECMRVTCRWCREENHQPLRCEEVERDGEVRIRTFLEEFKTEALGKRCPNPKCRKEYTRVEGCNHMTCPCGTHSCYLCGKQIDKKRPYDHYKDGSQGGGTNDKNSRCVVYGTPAWARKPEEQAIAEAEAALEDYIKENPELRSIMEQRGDVLKRTLSHVVGGEAKRKKPNKKSK
mmetsp:Transcript_3903/g.9470  ORF Transcript_3903/g.9470 Transcript_3903/m.9470 type:complete len:611 (+) Transcript_3903:54-1886(+)